ncbi:hypothetical protein [Kitasatospora sp. NPDC094016]|uniref:hypothetical protein n=1 Tax=Kitasatospora sp. NPDC094016 TaxID=3154986 RepID=UPI00332E9EAD
MIEESRLAGVLLGLSGVLGVLDVLDVLLDVVDALGVVIGRLSGVVFGMPTCSAQRHLSGFR